jgi:hypothetical protein
MADHDIVTEILSLLEELRVFFFSSQRRLRRCRGSIAASLPGQTRPPPRSLNRPAGIPIRRTEFWDHICLSASLCLTHSLAIRRFGVLIYITLLSMQPPANLWNQRLFNTVFSIMVTASQSIEESRGRSFRPQNYRLKFSIAYRFCHLTSAIMPGSTSSRR